MIDNVKNHENPLRFGKFYSFNSAKSDDFAFIIEGREKLPQVNKSPVQSESASPKNVLPKYRWVVFGVVLPAKISFLS